MKVRSICVAAIACLLICFSLTGQKLRDKVITFKHISMPYNATPLDYTTYSVEVGGEVLQISGVTPEGFARELKMQGFKRVNGYGGSAGHLHMVVDLGYLTVGKSEFKTHTEKVKDKSGNETVVKSYYFAVPFQGQYTAKVINPEGKILQSSSGNYNKVLNTSRVRNADVLRKSESKYINDLTRDAARDIKGEAYSTANGLLRSFDYRKTTSREQFYLIKKHSSEDQWEKHYENVKKYFEAVSHYPDIEYLKGKLQTSIDFYERMAAKDPKGDKKLLRIYKAAILNLATIHYYLDDIYTMSDIMGDASDKLKKDNRANRLVRKMKDTADKMRKTGLKTIYYKRELENAATPGEVANSEQAEKEMMEDKKANESYLMMNGQKVEGSILVDEDADDFVFGNGGNVTFIDLDNNEIDLTSSEVTDFYIADRTFIKSRFAPSAKGKSESTISILEKVYESERIKLYKYYPSSGALSDEKPEYAFQKKGQEHPISLESTQFLLWEKGLAKYFSDCADLAEMIADGGIEKTKESLLKAARVYSELCNEIIRP